MSDTSSEQVNKKDLDVALQKLCTAERERDDARRQRDENARRYQHDMQVMCGREQVLQGRIGELEEAVRRLRQGVFWAGAAGVAVVLLGGKR